ncbi:alpha/beta fold hydrolase [Enterococcus rivorum]|uniref:Alpha/beta hydrolase n=1 Tax=Enterococcus rivorum TaxID=762845 RepID=A0A1E5L1E3_9ENTE|nr:alpha/beta hydrolase [Enterococcus rivorum]MBP2098605.1 alpha-beta hydrolase superfamily lysophospholipase [Enterococcus rivorum]OEH83881.1 alpha/beta hydrolase [Enterococcus rivorum]
METSTIISSDKQTKLHTVCWKPKGEPKAIVQIIHGMAEYIERYSEFAEYLNQLGYLVVGHDHLGHGKSVHPEAPQYGYFGEETIALVLADIHQVRTWAQASYPDCPYFMMGHSMGSFALRNYLQTNSEGLNGVILMGTGSKPVGVNFALPLVKWLSKKNGSKKNPMVDKLAFGAFSKKFPEPSSFNWLSKNPENVANYEKDHLTGFTFTNNGFYTLFQLIEGANKKGWGSKLQKKLPILMISGAQDPVGDFGKGIEKVRGELAESGLTEVSVTLFPELRHEILLEEEKAEAYQVIEQWLSRFEKQSVV